MEIPELEFAILPKAERRVDTIYNLLPDPFEWSENVVLRIASAVLQLGDHVRKSRHMEAMSEDEATKICDTIEQLNILLDVEQPFTVRVLDPQGGQPQRVFPEFLLGGISDFKPRYGVASCAWDPDR